jgi:hypothetical protein
MSAATEIVAATQGLPRCPDCGGAWVERRATVNSNHVPVYNPWTRQLAGHRQGVATARLELKCRAGHRLGISLRGRYQNGELTGWEVVP